MVITQTEQGWYNFEARGTRYDLHFSCNNDEWELYSHRKALGRFHPPSVRFFKNLSDIENSLKSCRGISQLIEENNHGKPSQ